MGSRLQKMSIKPAWTLVPPFIFFLCRFEQFGGSQFGHHHPASMSESPTNDYSKGEKKVALGEPYAVPDAASYGTAEDLLGSQGVDPALDAKMHIVNNVR